MRFVLILVLGLPIVTSAQVRVLPDARPTVENFQRFQQYQQESERQLNERHQRESDAAIERLDVRPPERPLGLPGAGIDGEE